MPVFQGIIFSSDDSMMQTVGDFRPERAVGGGDRSRGEVTCTGEDTGEGEVGEGISVAPVITRNTCTNITYMYTAGDEDYNIYIYRQL